MTRNSGVTVLCCAHALLVIAACGEGTAPIGRNPGFLQLISGDGQTVAAGSPYAAPLVVRVLASDTLALRGSRVTFRIAAGTARIDSQSVSTDSLGFARAYVTPLAPGTVQVSASVFSSRFATTFLLAAGGVTAPTSCQPSITRRLVVAQSAMDLGGTGVCVGAFDSEATYVLVAFNSPAADATASGDIAVTISASGTGAAPTALIRVSHAPQLVRAALNHTSRPHALLLPLVPDAQEWWANRSAGSRSPAVLDTVGQLRQVNTNFSDPCTNPVFRTGRVVAVTTTAIVVADTSNAAGGLTNTEYSSMAVNFDTLVNPADTLNFKPPTDIDGNGRIVLFFTGAVNQQPPDVGPRTVLFQTRDLFPTAGGIPTRPACAASNTAELLYVAVPDAQGAIGAPRDKQALLTAIPRALAHEYQHLINASRRLYVHLASEFEELWLDEGLSQIAEELLFHRAGARQSRQNLSAYDLALTTQTLDAFKNVQRANIDYYGQFLSSVPQASPLSNVDSRATRGATWSLLRYLVDRRESQDFMSWTDLVNTTAVGMQNLSNVFGADVRSQMRDWAVALLTDDLFAASVEFQQPSWNFRSVFAGLQVQPYPLALTPLTSAAPVSVTLPPAAAAYLSFTVPANSAATISWSGASSSTISPMARWALVRLR